MKFAIDELIDVWFDADAGNTPSSTSMLIIVKLPLPLLRVPCWVCVQFVDGEHVSSALPTMSIAPVVFVVKIGGWNPSITSADATSAPSSPSNGSRSSATGRVPRASSVAPARRAKRGGSPVG